MPMMARTTLRAADGDDAEHVAAIYAPLVRDTAISFEVTPPDANEMRQRITHVMQRFPWLVAADDARIRGYAYAAAHHTREAYAWSVDVSVYVAPEAQRTGTACALYTSLLELLETQGYANAFAGIALPNDASVALHETLGFTRIGVYRDVGYKLGQWWDVGWWQRRLPLPVTSSRPTAWPDLPEAAITEALATGASLLRNPG